MIVNNVYNMSRAYDIRGRTPSIHSSRIADIKGISRGLAMNKAENMFIFSNPNRESPQKLSVLDWECNLRI